MCGSSRKTPSSRPPPRRREPPWGLDRIDQTDRPLNGTYTSRAPGSGVNAYIIDTGIRARTRSSAAARSSAFDAVDDGRNGDDCNGHGTHVAGHGRRHDLRRREERAARAGARAQLQRLRHDLGRDRRRRLGHGQPRRTRPSPT